MQNKNIPLQEIDSAAERLVNEGKTLMYMAIDGRMLGLIALADQLKPNARECMAALHKMGIATVMITGDNKRTAEAIAGQAGIERVIAEVLPEHKAEEVRKLQQEGLGGMVGDGINDAPAP